MAKFGNEEGVRKLGLRFRDQCFTEGRSIIDDRQIWTAANFNELYERYNQNLDTSNKSFDAKVEGQLEGASSGAIQLFAELYVLDLLVLGNVNPETKITKINTVLSWCQPPIELPSPITEVIEDGGVLNGGQGFNTRRFKQFWVLIELGRAFARMSTAERREALDTDRVEATVMSLPDSSEIQIQRVLCYLFAPEDYPPITATKHLAAITEHFGPEHLNAEEDEQLSTFRKVGLIQERIRAIRGAHWDFYLDREAWMPKSKPKTPTPKKPVDQSLPLPDSTEDGSDPEAFTLPRFPEGTAGELLVDPAWLERVWTLLENRKQLIFAGPPGTGKTFLAKSLAKKLSSAEENFQLVQFHASYGYEDFFEGYRPSGEANGAVSLTLKKGPLRRIVDAASDDMENPYFLVIDEINRGNLARIFGELYFLLEYREESVQLMYSGDDLILPPNLFIIGTMNTADRSIALVDAAIRRRFAFLELHPHSAPTSELLRRWSERFQVEFPLNAVWKELNARITAHGGDRNQLIGPSYFMSDYQDDSEGLKLTWDTEILPLLDEVFLDQYEWVRDRFSLTDILAGIGQ